MAEKERLYGGRSHVYQPDINESNQKKQESDELADIKTQNEELVFKINDLEQQIRYLQSKHSDYEDMLIKKDAQLAE